MFDLLLTSLAVDVMQCHENIYKNVMISKCVVLEVFKFVFVLINTHTGLTELL